MKTLERKVRLDGTVEEFLCDRLLIEPGRHATLRLVLDRDWTVAGGAIVVPKGTVTISHYWIDRPYNVYHWLRDGRTLAWYFNVTEPPVISYDLVEYLDLVVDVLITPDGTTTVLDEDDLPEDLSPGRRAIVARGLEAVTSAPQRLTKEMEAASRLYL
jgi:predicted RNA-binding protein associated with RNAse of E/G family